MRSNLIPITRIYDIYPKYTYSNDVKKFMDEIVDIDRVNIFTKDDIVDILDNKTNGNIVRKMFPDFKVKEMGDTVLLERYEPYCKMQFSKEYWNAQYKNKEI